MSTRFFKPLRQVNESINQTLPRGWSLQDRDGLTGEPVPVGSRSGAMMHKNDRRPATGSRSTLLSLAGYEYLA